MPKRTTETGIANTKFTEIDAEFCIKFVRLAGKKFPGSRLEIVVQDFMGAPSLFLNVDGKRAPAPYDTWIARGPWKRIKSDMNRLNVAIMQASLAQIAITVALGNKAVVL